MAAAAVLSFEVLFLRYFFFFSRKCFRPKYRRRPSANKRASTAFGYARACVYDERRAKRLAIARLRIQTRHGPRGNGSRAARVTVSNAIRKAHDQYLRRSVLFFFLFFGLIVSGDRRNVRFGFPIPEPRDIKAQYSSVKHDLSTRSQNRRVLRSHPDPIRSSRFASSLCACDYSARVL